MTRKSKYTIEFEKRFGDKIKSRSISNLSRFFKIKKSILQDAYSRGVGAFKNNRAAVREGVTSAEQWATPRLYKLILNIVDEKIPTGRGQDADLVKKALNV
jgi:hypothetical protein